MGNWIQSANLKKGSFTKKAQKAGESVQEYANEKADAPGKLGKQARLAKTFKKMGKKKRKKAPLAHAGAMANMLQKGFRRFAGRE